ncbi:allantoin permease [Aeromicrobium yanjiei]|uniref:Allantoin permease n=1 Tax=Aeromicrobium yanjiei TaxID=2662028 RepID=A0A5Q2MFA4_9ACTN|nr:allantoin permease [Aeromicrobium yanjiei]QGG41827.1 allantoin permease [Aeromicrobium yanjiei]
MNARTESVGGESDETSEHSHQAGKNSKGEKTEDYTARYTPRSYRRWGTASVATTALGGMAYLADFAIGASIGIAHGTINALVAIVVAAVIIFITALPLAYYSARFNIDLDLVTRGSGFGYYGSVLTAAIFGSYTFIFFALEGSIMAQGLRLGLHVPLWLGYLLSTLIVIPLIIYGMNTLTKVQLWTTPLWLFLMIAPVVYLAVSHPSSVSDFFSYAGESGNEKLSFASVMLGAGVVLSLIAQIGEQNDVLRFMPARTEENKRAWWLAVVLAGPGWVLLAILKQALGVFLAVYVLATVSPTVAAEPVEQFRAAFLTAVPAWLAITLAVILVVISQIKINVVNAYSGSLAWTNAYTRVTKHYPGRLVFLALNLAVALALMEGDMFSVLNDILGFYANCGIAWIVTVGADIIINKMILKLSPMEPEYRRTMLYAVNPVGVGSFLLATGLSWAVYFGALGGGIKPYSAIVAVVVALVATPLLAVLTKGRYYLKRTDDGLAEPRFDAQGNPSSGDYVCHVCHEVFERPDMMSCPTHGEPICSLCLATDRHRQHVEFATRVATR